MYTHPCSPIQSHIHTHNLTIHIRTPLYPFSLIPTPSQAGRHTGGPASAGELLLPPCCRPQHPVSLGGTVTQAKENRVSHQAWAKLEVKEDSPPLSGGKFGKIYTQLLLETLFHCSTGQGLSAGQQENHRRKKKWISIPTSLGPSRPLVSCTLTGPQYGNSPSLL